LNGYFESIGSSEKYMHFKSEVDKFEKYSKLFAVSSLNNHAINVDDYKEDVRVSRFIRDPRDLVVSGYYYHQRAGEPWNKIKNPFTHDWLAVNGCLPTGLRYDETFAEMLKRLPVEDGLIAQIDFRGNHFDSMRKWGDDSDILRTYKYEDIVGNERSIFEEMFNFYGFSGVETEQLISFVELYSIENSKEKSTHIRNPKGGQWRDLFTPKVERYFNERYSEVLSRYGYEID
jgi:hypothetical protein